MRLDELRRSLSGIFEFGAQESETDDVRLQRKVLITISVFLTPPIGTLWSWMYFSFGEPLAGYLVITLFLYNFLSLGVYFLDKDFPTFRFRQLLWLLIGQALIALSLGGFANSSALIVSSFVTPLISLLGADVRRSLGWLSAFLGVLLLSAVADPYLPMTNNLPASVKVVFFTMNISLLAVTTTVVLSYFIRQKNLAFILLGIERERSERLLLNVLPGSIAQILRVEDRTIADHFQEASILYADLVGFTPMSARLEPEETVDLLNELFSHFDTLVERRRVEKIRTIGDNYMVAAGIPEVRPDHAQALAHLALEMQEYIHTVPAVRGIPVRFRIGINSGPVVAGVIGRHKFHYDVWGDAVNTASRMESHGVAGKIQLTETTMQLIREEFECEPRGKIDVKGKGEMETWFLTGRK